MKEALVDISVLLIFFTRHEQFKQVFEQVRKVRPTSLFLYQDGPRKGRLNDVENIAKCREIAEGIDWECEVHRLYQNENIGVDPSGYVADRWAFSYTDKCIVLEDDVVPTISFFNFCKMMLDKYENDSRVMLISGMNIQEVTKGLSSDYFFSTTTFTWGWASWSRVVNNWDSEYRFLRNQDSRLKVRKYIEDMGLVKNMINVFQNHLDSGIEHFETILISHQYLHEGLTIVPTRNMINNIGVVADSTHFASDISLIAKGMRCIFSMTRYEIEIDNICHPVSVVDFAQYKRSAYRILGWGHPTIKIYRFIETTLYQLKKGDFEYVYKDFRVKCKKIFQKISS